MTITSIPLAPTGNAAPGKATSQETSRQRAQTDHAGRDDHFGALVEGHLAAKEHGDDKPAATRRKGHDDASKPTGDQAHRPAAVPAVVAATVAASGSAPSAAATPTAPVTGPAAGASAPTPVPPAMPGEQAGQQTQTATTPAAAGPGTSEWVSRVATRFGLPVTRPAATPATTTAAGTSATGIVGTGTTATGTVPTGAPVVAGQSTPTPAGAEGASAAGNAPRTRESVDAPESATPTTAPGSTPVGQPTAAPAPDDKTGGPTKHAATPEPATTPTSSSDSGATASTATAAVAPTATPVNAADTGPAQGAGAQATAVLDQVLPTLPRMVSRGDGAHSLTLKLHPADLGEVHLTVTVKNGTVDVTLAAGAAARDALRDDAGQLRSILGATGHTAGQLVIRDLPAGPASPATAPTDSSLTGQTFTDAGGGRGQQPEAGQQGRGTTPHTGPRPDSAGRAVPEPRTTPSTRAGNRALDVRI